MSMIQALCAILTVAACLLGCDRQRAAPLPDPAEPLGETGAADGAAPQPELLFSAITSNHYKELPCSPSLEGDAPGVAIAIPAQIAWGELIPVCGVLRSNGVQLTPNNLGAFAIQIKKRETGEFIRDPNHHLGEPPMYQQDESFKLLNQRDKIFFSGNVANKYTFLAPGAYLISLRHHTLESAPQELVVQAAGWRDALAAFFVSELCEGTLLRDLSPYIEQERWFSVVDIDTSTPEAAARFEERVAAHHASWRRLYAEHVAPKMQPEWTQGLVTDRGRSDVAMMDVVRERVEQTCPAKSDKMGDMVIVISAFFKLS